jgi:SAM-dependent methyltransferase
MGENNPYHRTAGGYDQHLSLPVISAIRQQEAQVVRDLIRSYSGPDDTALEIGPGTGFYTLMLAECVRHVTAIEDSSQMADILTEKLAAEGRENVTVLNRDFRTLDLERGFDLVVAIGVLDYIPEPEGFISKMCEAARKAVIFTAPQRGLWGTCFVASNRLRRISVFCHNGEALARWAPGWRCSITEVGLKTALTRGLTLIAALERDAP